MTNLTTHDALLLNAVTDQMARLAADRRMHLFTGSINQSFAKQLNTIYQVIRAGSPERYYISLATYVLGEIHRIRAEDPEMLIDDLVL